MDPLCIGLLLFLTSRPVLLLFESLITLDVNYDAVCTLLSFKHDVYALRTVTARGCYTVNMYHE